MEEHGNIETRANPNGHGAQPSAQSTGALDILWDGLPPKVIEELSKPLDPSLVSYRKGRGGRNLAYLEGHRVIDQANRIFGHGGWGYELVGGVICREARNANEQTGEVKTGLLTPRR